MPCKTEETRIYFRVSFPPITKFTRGPSVFHTTMRNKKVEFSPKINVKRDQVVDAWTDGGRQIVL